MEKKSVYILNKKVTPPDPPPQTLCASFDILKPIIKLEYVLIRKSIFLVKKNLRLYIIPKNPTTFCGI